jgi:hypothetical protein
MRLRSVFAFMIVLGVAALANMPPTKAASDVTILSHTGYIDSSGYFNVVGEVQNVGDQTVHVKIVSTFYDSGDVPIATEHTYAEIGVLLIGRKSPFKLQMYDTAESAKMDHYSLNMTFSVTSSIPIGLEILSNSSYISGGGSMHIVGEIKNIGCCEMATSIKVVATCYDDSGKVVAVSPHWGNVESLYPGSKTSYEILVDSIRVPYVERYELSAESAQYAVIPELPMPTILLVFMMASLLATAVYGKKHTSTTANL